MFGAAALFDATGRCCDNADADLMYVHPMQMPEFWQESLVEGWQPLPLKAREHIKGTDARSEIQSVWYHFTWARNECFQTFSGFEAF